MYVEKTDSTNSALSRLLQAKDLPDGFTLYTYHQTHGRGQRGNHWESEAGKNLLLSTLIRPTRLPASCNFLLSEVVALAVKNALDQHTNDIHIKWPNDIYWKDKKIGGILIENTWMGSDVHTCIAGIGLNLNQTHFVSDAPNPVSLKQITGQEYHQEEILQQILQAVNDYKQTLLHSPHILQEAYHQALYRRDDFYPYEDDQGKFSARIKKVNPDGQLVLETRDGDERSYYFKEVRTIL